MELQEYLLADETVHCRAEVEYGDTYSDGELVCTDTRLVLARERGILDIDLDCVEEISYSSGSIPWEYIGWTVLFVLIGLLGWLLAPEFLPGQLFGPIAVFAVVATVVAIYEAIRRRNPTLKIRTTTRSHVFRGDELAAFPNEIRQFDSGAGEGETDA
jgi:hypothetical protein